MEFSQLEIGLIILGLLVLFIGPHLCKFYLEDREDKMEKEKLINT